MPIFPKLKVKSPKLSNHDRSYYFRTSMSVGPLFPIAVIPCNAGDDNYLEFESLVNTQALLSPLYGSFKLKIMSFFAGTSLYCPKLWRNGSMVSEDGTLDANYPLFKFPSYNYPGKDTKFAVIRPDQLLAYLGFNPGYMDTNIVTNTPVRAYNALPLLIYWDIFRHYFANRQEVRMPYFEGGKANQSTNPRISWDNLSVLDDFYLKSIPADGGVIENFPSCISAAFGIGQQDRGVNPMQGFALGTYLPDRTNVILNSKFYKDNVTSVTVSTSGDSFQVDQLVTAKKLWTSRNKDAMSNGTFKDWVRMHYGVTPKIMDDMPTFLGATNVDIAFEDIRATTRAQVGDEEQYVGDKGSSGLGYGNSRSIRCVADRPGYIVVLAQIVPRVDYYQYLQRYVLKTKLSDEFRPEFNGIGLQDVLVSDLNADFTDLMSATGTPPEGVVLDPSTQSLGKQPAYTELMTALNTIRGSFCTTEKSWVLARDFRAQIPESSGGSIVSLNPVGNTDSSAYIMPDEWQQPFANQALYAQNFLVQFRVKNVVRSLVSKRLMPTF